MSDSTKTISSITEYEFHPFANAFPMMNDQEHAALVADIKANGMSESITLYRGKILDGRNRYKALLELRRDPGGYVNEEEQFDNDDDALAFVVSINLVRRHLTTSQRAMIAADLSTLGHGQRKKDTSNDVSQAEAAKMMHVSLPTSQRARKVKEKSPELAAAVRAGDVSVSGAVAQVDAARQGAVSVSKTLQQIEDESSHAHDLETHPTLRDAEYVAFLNTADKPSDELTEQAEQDVRRDRLKRYQQWQATSLAAAKTTDACDEMPDVETPPGTTDAEQRRFNFLYRASQAIGYGKENGFEEAATHEITKSIMSAAREAATVWSDLVRDLELRTSH
jgi:hypothetical protein